MGDSNPGLLRLAELARGLSLHEPRCLIYDTQEQQLAAALPYLKAGLERRERCLYITEENTAATILDALDKDGADVDGRLRNGAQLGLLADPGQRPVKRSNAGAAHCRLRHPKQPRRIGKLPEGSPPGGLVAGRQPSAGRVRTLDDYYRKSMARTSFTLIMLAIAGGARRPAPATGGDVRAPRVATNGSWGCLRTRRLDRANAPDVVAVVRSEPLRSDYLRRGCHRPGCRGGAG